MLPAEAGGDGEQIGLNRMKTSHKRGRRVTKTSSLTLRGAQPTVNALDESFGVRICRKRMCVILRHFCVKLWPECARLMGLPGRFYVYGCKGYEFDKIITITI